VDRTSIDYWMGRGPVKPFISPHERIEKLEMRVEQLATALVQYGQHKAFCQKPCSCGLLAAVDQCHAVTGAPDADQGIEALGCGSNSKPGADHAT
jgi:hypothetical protein